MAFTTEQNIEKLDNTSNPDETFNDFVDNMDVGRTFAITAAVELSQYDIIYIADGNKKSYLADANFASKEMAVGMVKTATIAADGDGFAYGIGAVVTNVTWTWDLSKPIFLSDTEGEMSQTASTSAPVIIGFPTAETKMILLPLYLNFQLATIADTAAASAITATSPGTGADATTWTGAQCTAAKTDLDNIKTNLDLLNATQDAILARLEVLGISATS